MIAEKTGLQHFALSSVWMVYDTLYCERTHNFTLPAWVTPQLMEHLNELKEYTINAEFGLYRREEKSRLQGGLLLNQIVQNIIQAVNVYSPTPRLKLIMYSAHDTTIIALQMALNIYSLAPPYASCHIFELYEEDDGSFTVEMYYRNQSDSKAHLLTLPSCTNSCPLHKFIQITSSVIPENREEECRAHYGRIQIERIVGLLVGSCLLLMLIGLCVKLSCRNKRQSLGYQQLPATCSNQQPATMRNWP
uniref:lysosomal acid phosphatase-like n=1 Tax=Pristiophorus japonicus TaxID=55135 RepID=UPI00398F2306